MRPAIFLAELPIPDAPGIHLPGGKGLDDHRGLFGQPGEILPVLLRVLEIESHVPFIAPFHQERNSHPFDLRAVRSDLAHGVPFGGLDFNDLGPEFGKEAGRDDSGKIPQARVQDQDIVQHFGLSFRVHDLGQGLPPGSEVLLGLPRGDVAGVYLFLLPFAAHFFPSLP